PCTVAYGLIILLSGYTAARSGRAPGIEETAAIEGEHRPGLRQYLLWLVLPACASILLLAVTNHLSQNVAAIPFLWVLPLSIYLLTFIICFDREKWYWRGIYIRLAVVALGGMAYALSKEPVVKISIPLF